MIRFDRIRAHDLGVLRDVDIDLASIPGTLVAVTGPNGSGKSTFLGLLAAALYRDAPTRGSLVDLARSRTASLEVSFVHGAPWTVKHLVDGVGKKSEATAFDADGAPATDSGKVRAFDQWAAKALPRAEVFLSSIFLPQGSRGFLGLSASERKGVLLRVLGVERFELLAADARERARAAKAAADVVRGKILEVGAGPSLDEALDVQAQRQAEAAGADAAVVDARAEVEREESALASAREVWAIEQERLRSVNDVQRRLDGARACVVDIERRIANNRLLLDESGAIGAAVERVRVLTVEHDTIAAERAAWERGATERAQAERAASKALQGANARFKSAVAARNAAWEREQGLAKAIHDATAKLPEARRFLAADRELVAALEAQVAELRERRVFGADERIAGLRSGATEALERLKDPARGVATPGIILLDALRADDEAAQAAVEVPPALAEAERRLAAAVPALRRSESEVDALERTVARGPELEQAGQDSARTKADEQAVIEATNAAAEASWRLVVAAETDARRWREVDDRRGELEAELGKLAPVAEKAASVARAAGRIAELETQLEQEKATVTDLESALRGLAFRAPAVPPQAPSVLALSTARAASVTADDLARKAGRALALAEADVTRARASADRLAELRAELLVLDADVADWTRLSEDLGRDGLQAAEIDAAGPELTELVNDLLRTCVGPRWTVTVDTQKLSADGKKTLEGLEVRVLDVERGREAPAETLSGGEMVLVGEAVSLAITMLACRRAGVRGATLIRDESGAALDPGAARSYVAMLRRAADLVGARQVLFVSHAPEVVEMADARIVLSGGTAVVG